MTEKSQVNQPATEINELANLLHSDNKIRLALAEDSSKLQKLLANNFGRAPEIELVITANNGIDLLAKLEVVKELPHIILMDIRMPQMDGIEATKKVLAIYPSIKIIAYSFYDNEENIIAMYMHGAKGFVKKGEDFDEIMVAIRAIHEGKSYVTAEALEVIQQYLQKIKLADEQNTLINLELANQLSGVELQILYHTAQFKSIPQISELLCKSPNTINNQLANLRKKLGLKGKKSILQFALLQIETIKYLLKIKK